ncbi:helix-turn-helix transcriptional regulator [Catenovulum sp. SM1970]|uniref:AraC family transcriptional regulator n=1 Tax=Marinifaba aquimaris TaxID=2741323 RepID=UPI0015744B38|nr:helix-turn-helix transcriptional regulator [Marinifaba aquimaris]NTS77204.1 helix-turn-helix transcriptional regulator [Marinifaba aquimaris]
MTSNLPKQTLDSSNISLAQEKGQSWEAREPSREYQTLPRPVVPLSNEFPAMTQINKHTHPWSQLAYSTEGVMHIETSCGLFIVPPEQALWLPPNIEHQHFCRQHVAYRSLHIQAELGAFLGEQVRSLRVEPLLKQLILTITSWPKHYQQTPQTDRLIAVLLDQLALAPDNDLFMPTINDKRLLPIIETLSEQPANKLSLEQWADKVGASSRTLNRLFNQYYGMGFSRWKQKLKILKSLDMINAQLPLAEIAYQLGYESASSFVTAFKKQLKVSPKKYFNQHH